MGSIFISNNSDQSLLNKIISLYALKDMKKYVKFSYKEYIILYFSKINNPVNQIYQYNDDLIFNIGTIFYKNKMGFDAIREISQDIDNNMEVFPNLKGHYNLIIIKRNNLTLVSDKVGFMQIYQYKKNNMKYLSNSFLALCEIAESLTFSQQEAFEFITTDSVYGGNSIFKEIYLLESGKIYDLTHDKTKKYIDWFEYHDQKPSINTIYETISKHFNIFKNLDVNITADMSGGYDTRLLNAILKNKKINYTMNTNTNLEEKELPIVQKIFQNENIPHKIYYGDSNSKLHETVLKALYCTEMARPIFITRAPSVFNEKSRDFQLILGGYGGELLRDKKTMNIKSYQDLYVKRYLGTSIIFNGADEYYSNLSEKFKTEINVPRIQSEKDVLTLYYLIRMKYWGGSRISYYNQYCNRYHPLLELEIMSQVLNVEPKLLRNAKLQKLLITKFDKQMASYKSVYGFNFLYKEDVMTEIKYYKKNIKDLIELQIRKHYPKNVIEKRLKYGNMKLYNTMDENHKNIVEDKRLINKYIDINERYCKSYIKNGVYTINVILNKYKSKLN